MERDLSDAVRHVLEALCLGLPTRVHHHGDCRDGKGEGVELLLQSYDSQNRYISTLVYQLKNVEGMNLLTIAESDSANCSLVRAKDPLLLDNTASRVSSCSWRR